VTVGATGTGLFWTEFHPWTNHGRISQSSGSQGGMMRRPVYALAAALGSLPVPVRAVMVVTLVILVVQIKRLVPDRRCLKGRLRSAF
jgi:hypothetical protein